MAQSPQAIKDVAAAGAGFSASIGQIMDVVSVAIAMVVSVLSIIALLYSIKLRRRQLKRK